MAIPVVSVVGWHNAGKTTFVERLIAELKRRGLRVATIKHSREHFQVDREGTDTWRYAQAGSDVVLISGQGGLALIERREDDLSLEQIVARVPPDVDLIIAEGFKRAHTPKIEVTRAGVPGGRIAPEDELLALVTDDLTQAEGSALPGVRFAPEDAVGVADLMQARGFLNPRNAA
jgi:molybdopterin-guanine dinucleotide biosynthesis protein MobB